MVVTRASTQAPARTSGPRGVEGVAAPDARAAADPAMRGTGVRAIPAVQVRGGTSKCWIFRAEDLPGEGPERDRVLLRIFGSPDTRQIDGVGGASSTTSKAIIVEGVEETEGAEGAPATRVIYRFAQISVAEPVVEWESNCGNCATGLALYALHTGLVPAREGRTRLSLLNRGTGLVLDCEIPTPGATVPASGERRLEGQHYSGVPVDMAFSERSWSSYGAQLPTGRAQDTLELDGFGYRLSLIDAGAPVALFDAADFGWTGERDGEREAELVQLAPRLRSAAARLMGVPDRLTSIPKVGFIAPPPRGCSGVSVRMISMDAFHPAIGLTSAVAVAVAAGIPGSVVDRNRGAAAEEDDQLSLHLPQGSARLRAEGQPTSRVSFERNARVISEGSVFFPEG